jgi:hypothetical protein
MGPDPQTPIGLAAVWPTGSVGKRARVAVPLESDLGDPTPADWLRREKCRLGGTGTRKWQRSRSRPDTWDQLPECGQLDAAQRGPPLTIVSQPLPAIQDTSRAVDNRVSGKTTACLSTLICFAPSEQRAGAWSVLRPAESWRVQGGSLPKQQQGRPSLSDFGHVARNHGRGSEKPKGWANPDRLSKRRLRKAEQ